MLLRAARREAARRGPRLQITGPELEDLAYQAAGDALLAITQKVSPASSFAERSQYPLLVPERAAGLPASGQQAGNTGRGTRWPASTPQRQL